MSEPLVLNVCAALRVPRRPADAPFSELSSLGRRAAMIPAMLAGAMIFSRSMWALVDLLIPPTFELVPASRAFSRRGRVVLSSLSSPILSRFGGSSIEGARGSPAVGVWRDFAEGKVTTTAAGFAERNPRASAPQRQEREDGAPARNDNPERLRVEGREAKSGREESAWTATRQRPPPPSPSLPPTAAVVDSDDEDEGWVSEEEQAVGRGPRDVCDEVDGRSQEDAPEAGGDCGGDDAGGDAFRQPDLGNDAPQGIHQGDTSLDSDGAPRGVRSWEAGSIRRNQSARRQKGGKGGGDGTGGGPGGRRLDSSWEGSGQDTDKDEEITTGSNHRASLDSVEEVDEETGGSSNFVLGKSGWRRGPRLHEGKGDPVSIDGFIVKK